ncbi:tetratricopeptide repeat protein [Roseospira visakhapatnamensis]|uniref:Tetratricopeptide (TPR) repeat protein n=1 Tax=Roseospira visakhapatnamensis TaxID=390880 RepID=A0A7W6RGB3_9PROT|nr:tetratricopeptide repeat protein [Roseospira visakhapatnamensis]MBB4268044.1 tetratricopeptide (TPR) repeat protein [Roseospira visakhapatnamensis]
MALSAVRVLPVSWSSHGRRPSRLLARAGGLVLTLALVPAACAQPPGGGASDAASARMPWQVAEDGGTGQGVGADDGATFPGAAVMVPARDPGTMARALGKFLAGRTAQHANDIPAAADSYAAALEADPDNPELMRRAYYYLAADGRLPAALETARRALEVMPDDDFAPLLLATEAMRDDDPATAVTLIDGLEVIGLNTLLRPLLGGWARLGRGDGLAVALETLEPANSLPSARPLVELHAAIMARVANDAAISRARLDAYMKDHALDSPRAGRLVAELLVWQNRPDEARALVQEQRASRPGSLMLQQLAERLEAPDPSTAMSALPSTAGEGFAEALYHVGLVVNQGQGSDTAIVLFQLARAVRPDFPTAAVAIAETLRRMDRFADADRVLTDLDTSADPALGYLVQLYRAENLENMDRVDDALERYAALADARPDQAEPLVDMGDLLRREERYGEAAAVYGRAIDRLAEDDPGLWPILYRRGIAHERAGQWARAEADFLRTLELHPGQPEVLNYLGYSWLDRGEHIERAVEMIQDAVRQRPRDGYIVDSLGWGYYLLGRYAEAVEELERAVELRPQDPTINDHLGDAYWRVGRRTEARFQWERALSLEPDPGQAEDLRRKLREGLGDPDAGTPADGADGADDTGAEDAR